MRNYLKIYRNEIVVSSGSQTLSMPCFGDSEENLALQNNREIAALGTQPMGTTVSTTSPFVNYIELDRDIIMAAMTFLFRFIQQIPGKTFPSFVGQDAYSDFSDQLVSESPKKSWSNGH